MKTETPDEVFERLSRIYFDTVSPFVEPNQPYALMDFPAHHNGGDSAIWLGQLAFFDKHVGRPASFVCTLRDDPAAVQAYVPEGPVFIQGGGNFGDIWPNHHNFRLRAWEVLKGRPIVQLPQSIHFNDPALVEETARAIENHGQVTLITRDQVSFEFAKKAFPCEVFLSPDSAVNLHKLAAPVPTAQVLSCLRDDREGVWNDAMEYLKGQGEVTDWGPFNVWTLADRLQIKLWNALPATKTKAMAHRETMFRRHATKRLQNGVNMMAPGQVIVTDRLHGHLISSLMRRPHLVLDNAYGKIARHIETWGNFGLAERVTDIDHLMDAIGKFTK